MKAGFIFLFTLPVDKSVNKHWVNDAKARN